MSLNVPDYEEFLKTFTDNRHSSFIQDSREVKYNWEPDHRSLTLNDGDNEDIVITNTGSLDLIVQGITNYGVFHVTGYVPACLAAGDSFTLTVRFEPSKVGDYSGYIRIVTDAEVKQDMIFLHGQKS